MKAKLFSSKSSKSQPQVEIPQAYSNPPIQDPRYLAPEQYPPPGLPAGIEGQQLPPEPPLGQRHYSVPAIDPAIEGPAAGYGRESREHPPEQRFSSYLPPNSPIVEKEQRRGLRDRLGIGHSSKQSVDQGPSRATGLGRTLSVRRKDSVPDKHIPLAEDPQRALRGGSSSQLLIHSEEEEAQHNTFTIQHPYEGPPVPIKDQPPNTIYARPGAQQIYYPPPPPPLQRVDTDHSIQSTPPIDTFSPAGQHPASLAENQASAGPFLPPSAQTQQLQHDLFAAPATALGISTPQIQPPPNQAGPYAYQPPLQDPQFQARQQLAQQNDPQSALSGRSSFEAYQRQQQQIYLPPDARVPQSRVLGNNPAGPNPNQNSAYLQAPATAPAPGTEPPSPLQQPVPDHQVTIISQPGSQEPSPTDSQKGGSPISTMPQGPPRGSSMRQPEKGMPPASRESSSLGQQGAPLTPGVQAFNSNIVPPGSRGQPHREGQAEPEERGRDSPPRELTPDDADHYFRLVKEHKELKEKYTKVKKYYFEKESQVHHLQNTLANQRLSQSRTSLDDSEYTARFSRLDGLISQLAFTIRKNWKKIPEFLERGINKEAMATGKQEMTAVGRAFISYWLVSEIFDKYFHPDLDITLSQQLQRISHNIRRNAPFSQSAEEEDNLQSKVINWRLTTLEGLQDQLKAPAAAQNNAKLVELLNQKLADDLGALLQDPAPPDLQSGIPMIVELAIKIAIHLPCESREVMVDYYLPCTPFMPDIMKVETGIPALTNPIEAWKESPSDEGSVKSAGTKGAPEEPEPLEDPRDREKDDKGRRGMFGSLMGGQTLKKPPPGGADPRAVRGSNERAGGSQTTLSKESGRETPTQMKEERVRLSVGISVQIRGRSVLAKAPVYTMS